MKPLKRILTLIAIAAAIYYVPLVVGIEMQRLGIEREILSVAFFRPIDSFIVEDSKNNSWICGLALVQLVLIASLILFALHAYIFQKDKD